MKKAIKKAVIIGCWSMCVIQWLLITLHALSALFSEKALLDMEHARYLFLLNLIATILLAKD